MISSKKNIIDTINSPDDLKKVSEDKLMQVCDELRQVIIDEVSSNPAHFGASLGVVELTVALHYILNTPYDNLIWDVGHQAYGHKILTGRKDKFNTNRKLHGISGFPNPKESEYDAFGVGHSSTSISAALGMAIAAKQKEQTDRRTVAVIGDGSMSAGLAYEALNNAASNNADILVILNDNNMAIDPSVGGLNEYLLDITTSQTYNKVRDDIWRILGKFNKVTPNMQKLFQKVESGIKTILLRQSNLFEAFNFRYFGPVDGHNVNHLVKVLTDLQKIPGPKLLHVITKKGKGFKPAEENQTYWHAPQKFNKETGEIVPKTKDNKIGPKFQDVFGETIIDLAKINKNIVGITPAMPTGCSLNKMMKEMPDRAFDVGIAEQHAVTFSAGMAINGLMPFCNIYSTFMQRAYDQVIHDVAIQNLNMVMCLDRGGLVGADGATHHGVYDLAFFRCIPNLTIASPLNEIELRNMMYTAQLPNKGPVIIRYPRGCGRNKNWKQEFQEIKIGEAKTIRKGNHIAIISIGAIGMLASDAIDHLEKENITVQHIDIRFLKPLDKKILHETCSKFKNIISLEDASIVGGLGTAIMEFANENNYNTKITKLGVPDEFIEHGTQEELYKQCEYSTEDIIQKVKNLISK